MESLLRVLLPFFTLYIVITLGDAQTPVFLDPVRDTNWFLPLNVSSTDNVTCSVAGDDKAKTYFRIYPNTCLLTYRTSLEADPNTIKYDVTVDYHSASDPTNVSSLAVTVFAQRNLHAPTFTPTSYWASIEDSQLPGSSVISVNAMDADVFAPANTFQYQFAQYTDFFEINGLTGEIRIKQMLSLDGARLLAYRLVTLAVDEGSRPLTGTAAVMITVSRNQSPIFLNSQSYNRVVPESADVLKYVILRVTALDNDNPTSPNGQVTYSISTEAANRVFHMNASTGEITPRVDLKTAPSTSWAFEVTAKDGGIPPLFTTATVYITIVPAGQPQFLPSEYQKTVSDSLPLGATVLSVMATDPLGAELEYELIGDGLATSYFSVNSSTGIITLSSLLTQDNTYTLTYHLRIRASRKSDTTAQGEGRVVINVVRNANTPSFSNSNFVYNVVDTSLPGESIGNFTASDSDTGPAGTVQYSIDQSSFTPSQASSYFFINPTTGQLLLTASLADDPQTTEYRFSVVASDKGVPPKKSSVQVRVQVPRNPNRPFFSSNFYTVAVQENLQVNQPVVNVTALDADGDGVRYSIIHAPPDSLYFSIDPSTGQVILARPIFDGTQVVYTLTVVAVDNAASPSSSTAAVIVNVIRNPNSPVFQPHPSSLNISSYINPGTVIIRLAATDADSPNIPSGQLQYSLSTKNEYFTVNPTNGDVITLAPFTSSIAPIRFVLRVIVTDKSATPNTATAEVVINIVGNEHAPVFPVSSDNLVIAGPGEVYKVLYSVTAIDADSQDPFNRNTPNAEVTYAIVDSQEARRLFRISESGDVYMVQPLDRNVTGIFSMDAVIRASDKGWNPQYSEMTLNVTFMIDQQPTVAIGEPGFKQPVYHVTVPENLMSNEILRMELVNVGSNQHTCLILSGNDLSMFTLQPTADGKACMLSRQLWRGLDADTQSNFQLRVRLVPVNSRTKRASGDTCTYNSWHETEIFIEVTDLNDNKPMFVFPQQPSSFQDTYFAAIASSAKPLTHVMRVQAVDKDSGSLGRVTYTLDNVTSTTQPFFISPIEGEIQTALEFNQMSPHQYQLTVRARDSPLTGSPLSSDAKLVVNLIEDFNRFVLTVKNKTTKDLIVHYKTIKKELQKSYGHPVLIERIQASRQASLHGVTVYPDSTDIIFVIVGNKNNNYQLLKNTNQATFGKIMSDEAQVKSNMKTNVNLNVEDVMVNAMTSTTTIGTSTSNVATKTTHVMCEFPRRDINSGMTVGSVPLSTALLSLIGYWLAH